MLWLVCGAAAVFALYLFLTAPNRKDRRARGASIPRVAYAHRGLHGLGIPENSLTAFDLAGRRGYGVELDVHVTRDGKLAVMHDVELKRMCGVDGSIFDRTMEELSRLRLNGTDEPVPSLSQALDRLAPYRTPLIVEMKSDRGTWRALPGKLAQAMEDYPGFWCVESFDPRMLRWFRKNAPGVVRGQLSFDPARLGEHKGEIGYALGARLLMNALSRPDFVAYGHETAGNLSFRIIRRVFHPVMAAWTVTSQKDFERLRNQYDLQIFEGFEP